MSFLNLSVMTIKNRFFSDSQIHNQQMLSFEEDEEDKVMLSVDIPIRRKRKLSVNAATANDRMDILAAAELEARSPVQYPLIELPYIWPDGHPVLGEQIDYRPTGSSEWLTGTVLPVQPKNIAPGMIRIHVPFLKAERKWLDVNRLSADIQPFQSKTGGRTAAQAMAGNLIRSRFSGPALWEHGRENPKYWQYFYNRGQPVRRSSYRSFQR